MIAFRPAKNVRHPNWAAFETHRNERLRGGESSANPYHAVFFGIDQIFDADQFKGKAIRTMNGSSPIPKLRKIITPPKFTHYVQANAKRFRMVAASVILVALGIAFLFQIRRRDLV